MFERGEPLIAPRSTRSCPQGRKDNSTFKGQDVGWSGIRADLAGGGESPSIKRVIMNEPLREL